MTNVIFLHRLKKISFLIILLMFVFTLSACSEDRTFDRQFYEGSVTANQILTQYKICSPKNHNCNTLFFLPLSGGFEVSTYGITDQKILIEVAQVFTKKFMETPTMQHLVIIAYPLSKEEDLKQPFTWNKKSIFYIKMKR